MISHDLRCIFIHIPKCAGTSIEVALGLHGDGNEIKPMDHRSLRMLEKPVNFNSVVHSKDNILEYTKRLAYLLLHFREEKLSKQIVDQIQFKQYFKFVFVRNPWSRAYSWYQNVMRGERHQKRLGISKNTDFKSFLKKQVNKGALRPQTHWIKSFEDKERTIDFIGKFENLNDDFAYVCKKLALSDVKLPHYRNGKTEKYTDAYDSEARELIQNVYSEEIELFGYSFEL